MAIVPRTDHVALGLDRLPEQFKRQPKLAAVLTPWLVEVQRIEDMFAALAVSTVLASISGALLDRFGRLVGEARMGRSDNDYRNRLNVRVMVNRSRGTVPDLLKIANRLTNNTATVTTEPVATVVVESLSAMTAADAATLADVLNQAKAVGVRLEFVFAETAPGTLFVHTAGAESAGTDGYANAAETTGGLLSNLAGDS